MKLLNKLYSIAKRVAPVLTVVLLTLQISNDYFALVERLNGVV